MRLVRSTFRGPPLGAIFGSVLLLSTAAAGVWLRLGLPRPICLFREWTGVPCPTCGSTRMIEALLHGDVAAALAWNPLALAGLAAIAVWAAASAARRWLGLHGWRVVLEGREPWLLRLSALTTVVAGWGYLVWRGV